jgi:hypothetical protein
MTDFTYETLTRSPTVKSDTPTKVAKAPLGRPESKSLLRVIYESLIEARRLQAELLVEHHLYGAF